MTQIITAIDVSTVAEAQSLSNILQNETLLKFGLEFAESCGPQGLLDLDLPEHSIFLDHKWVDIPNTVSGAALAALKYTKPAIVNVYAMGGVEMMRKAVEAVKSISPETKVIAVTLLTSLGYDDISLLLDKETDPRAFTLHLAELSKMAGCDGVVCSGLEITAIKSRCGADFLTVVPGIRPKGSETNDQQRIMTPKQAADAGADYLVIGRPITQADDVLQAARDIKEQIS